MTEKTDDEKWLEALRGQTEGEPSKPELEATLIRSAVVRGTQSRSAYETTEGGFQQLLTEAQKQRLIRSEKTPSALQRLINTLYEFLAAPAGVMASLTLILGLSVTAGWQAEQLNSADVDTVRGGTSAERINQIVPSAQAAAAVWQKDLLDAGVGHTVSFESPGRILIRMQLSPAAIDLLMSKRIQPPAGQWCTLVIVAEPVRPQ